MILNGHDQTVNDEIRLLYSFQSEMEKLYTVSKNKNQSMGGSENILG